MSTITLSGTKWQVKIRRKGQPNLSATFVSEEAATRWAEEHKRRATTKPIETGPTAEDLFRKYIAHPMPDKRSCEWDQRTLQRFLKREAEHRDLSSSRTHSPRSVQFARGKSMRATKITPISIVRSTTHTATAAPHS